MDVGTVLYSTVQQILYVLFYCWDKFMTIMTFLFKPRFRANRRTISHVRSESRSIECVLVLGLLDLGVIVSPACSQG